MANLQIFLSRFLWIGILFACFTACEPDPDLDSAPIPEFLFTPTFALVDTALWTHFSDFEVEAEKRGWLIDLDELQISGAIVDIAQQHVAGQCTYSSAAPGEVTIDKEFWDNSSALFREFVVFHELGHCVLGLGHEEGVDASGNCISIMRSGVEDCRDNYRTSTRKEYLDELFSKIGGES